MAVERKKTTAEEARTKELEQLKRVLTKAGDLESAKLADQAIAGTLKKGAELPKRLEGLLERHESNLRRELEPVRRIYRTELKKLKRNFTGKGDLDGALAVDKELAAVSPKKENGGGRPTSKRELADWVSGTEWKVVDGMPGTFFFVDKHSLERRTGSGAVAFTTPFEAIDKDHIKYATPKGDKRQIFFKADFKSFEHLVEQNGVRFRAELMSDESKPE